MNDFSMMHVFFFITSVAVVIFIILLAVVTIFFIKILNDIKYISGKAKKEADLISEDLADLHAKIRAGGARFGYFFGFLKNIFKHHKK